MLARPCFFINDNVVQVYAWEIADQLLLLKRDIETSYFGAQTMQNKVRFSFEELPKDLHMVSALCRAIVKQINVAILSSKSM